MEIPSWLVRRVPRGLLHDKMPRWNCWICNESEFLMSSGSGHNPFSAKSVIDTPLGKKTIYRLDALHKLAPVDHLPYSIKVLLEACLRHCDGHLVTEKDVEAVLRYDAKKTGSAEIPFMPGRVVLQDFTGVPAVVDLAAMRAAMKEPDVRISRIRLSDWLRHKAHDGGPMCTRRRCSTSNSP